MSRTVGAGPADWAGSASFPVSTVLTQGAAVRDRAVSVDPGGSAVIPMTTATEYKGADQSSGRFAELVGTA